MVTRCVENIIQKHQTTKPTIEEAIEKLQVDTSQFIPVQLFAREIYGIYIRMEDTCKIMLIVDKPYILTNTEMEGNFKTYAQYVLKSKIKGLCWKKNKQRKRKDINMTSHIDCWDY
jgi:hypothetical protein